MISMKRRTAIAVTLGVWVSALGSATALTYDLKRPLHSPGLASLVVPRVDSAPAAAAGPVAEEQGVLSIPTITVVGHVRRHSAVAVTPEPAPESAAPEPGMAGMHCAEWRELDMGSGRVRVCE